MLFFWKQTIYEYCYSVENKFGVKVNDLTKKFTLHDRVPCGLPLIAKELAKQNSLATRQQILQGSLYDKAEKTGGKRAFVAGVASAVASGLYNNTFGYMFGGVAASETDQAEDEGSEEELVCVDYLERQSDIFCRWAFKNQLNLLSLAKAKLNLQSSTQHTLEDIELLLKHLEHSGRVLVQRVGGSDASDENTIIKFLQPSERNKEASIIT